jgi:hypothetical protein
MVVKPAAVGLAVGVDVVPEEIVKVRVIIVSDIGVRDVYARIRVVPDRIVDECAVADILKIYAVPVAMDSIVQEVRVVALDQIDTVAVVGDVTVPDDDVVIPEVTDAVVKAADIKELQADAGCRNVDADASQPTAADHRPGDASAHDRERFVRHEILVVRAARDDDRVTRQGGINGTLDGRVVLRHIGE